MTLWRRWMRATTNRYRTLYDESPNIIYLMRVEPDNRFVYEDVNDTAFRLTGIPRDKMIGLTPQQVFRPADAALMQCHFERCVALREEIYYDIEGPLAVGTVSRRTIVKPMFVDDTICFLFCTSLDMTETRRMEAQFRHAQKMEALGQLTAGIAHEFNNILAAVIGNLDILSMRAKDEATVARITPALQAAERGAKLTEQLLAFSRKQPMVIETFNLNAACRNIESLLGLPGRHRLVYDFETDPVLALGDQQQVEQSLLNLVLNARDAMPNGGVIRLTTRYVRRAAPQRPEEPPPGSYAALTVIDEGEGIPHGDLNHLFEPFFTTKAPGKGTGLGLSQVLGVAKQSGGGVRVESSSEGTKMTIYLRRP